MPLLNAITHRVVRGRASRGLARAIPNPLVRYAVIALLPMLLAKLAKRRSDPRDPARASGNPDSATVRVSPGRRV